MSPTALKLRGLFFSTAILALASLSAQSAVLTVTNTQDAGAGSLRSAIAMAAPGDAIHFNIQTSDNGYNGSANNFTITLASGEIVIAKDLTIAGPSAANVALNGNHASRIFNITAGTVAISNLSFINGKAKGANGNSSNVQGQPGMGGAVLNQSILVLTRCTFEGNTAVGGNGGYFGEGGEGQGGAIANQHTLSLVACTLDANLATGGFGGAVFSTIPPVARGGAGTGGGVYNAPGANLSLTNCTMTANRAEGVDGAPTGFANPASDARGGGVANFGTLSIEHCTLANNQSLGGDSSSGGIGGPNNGGAGSGGGLYGAAGSVSSTRNTIFGENKVVGGIPGGSSSGQGGLPGVATGPDVSGAVTSHGHNLLGRSDGNTGFTGNDQQGGTTNATRLDPKLGTLGNYGGRTPTLPLLVGSPAIDGADTAEPAHDQRGFVRVGPPDIGAFEYQGTQPIVLANISTRLQVQTADNAMIGGFIITGTEQKTVIVRGIGPSLPLAGALADPFIEVYGPSGEFLATNDNWREATTRTEIAASGLAPANDLEPALWGILNPGAYTVVVRGKNDSTGIGLFEVYDLDNAVESNLGNISTRGLVGTGNDVMIGGTIVVGTVPGKVLFRAIGPSLTNFGVSNALGDPVLELHDGDGVLIATNYDWRDTQEAEIIATGLQPSNNLESAILRDLAPGPFTAIVRGLNNTTGVALVEAYNLN
ncbi:MAG: choice-of-anchor Q domain-containing protein [Chthoniobacterales bacterium]